MIFVINNLLATNVELSYQLKKVLFCSFEVLAVELRLLAEDKKEAPLYSSASI